MKFGNAAESVGYVDPFHKPGTEPRPKTPQVAQPVLLEIIKSEIEVYLIDKVIQLDVDACSITVSGFIKFVSSQPEEIRGSMARCDIETMGVQVQKMSERRRQGRYDTYKVMSNDLEIIDSEDGYKITEGSEYILHRAALKQRNTSRCGKHRHGVPLVSVYITSTSSLCCSWASCRSWFAWRPSLT